MATARREDDVYKEEYYQRLKKINYSGCKKFFKEVRLEIFHPDEWFNYLQGAGLTAEEVQFVKSDKVSNTHYCKLEGVLLNRPEIVCEVYKVLMETQKSLRGIPREKINILVGGLSKDSFHSEDEKFHERGYDDSVRKNFRMNIDRINFLKNWAIDLLSREGVLSNKEAMGLNHGCEMYDVLLVKLDKIWDKFMNFLVVYKLKDLERCMKVVSDCQDRTEEEVEFICKEVPLLPHPFVRRDNYCDRLERSILDAGNSKKMIVLYGEHGIGKTSLAIFATHFVIKRELCDQVRWLRADRLDFLSQESFHHRTLVVVLVPDSISAKDLRFFRSRPQIMIIVSKKQVEEEDAENICIDRGFNLEECKIFLSHYQFDDFLVKDEELAKLICQEIGNSPQALHDVVYRIRKNVEDIRKRRFGELRQWLEMTKTSVRNKSATHLIYETLERRNQDYYEHFILFVDVDFPICIPSMMHIWDLNEMATRSLLDDFSESQLLIKGKYDQELTCYRYSLDHRHIVFLRERMTVGNGNNEANIINNTLAKYEKMKCRQQINTQDTFFCRQYVRLYQKQGQHKKARQLLSNWHFLEARLKAGDRFDILRDFCQVSRSNTAKPSNSFCQAWAFIEMVVPSVLATKDLSVIKRTAKLHLVKLSPNLASPCSSKSWRLHSCHKYKPRNFLPKETRRRVGRKFYPREEFYTDVDKSADGKLIILGSNLAMIYLLDDTYEVISEFECGAHVFLVRFLNDQVRVIAVTNHEIILLDIRDGNRLKRCVEPHFPTTFTISNADDIKHNLRMPTATFRKPVALLGNTLWVADETNMTVYWGGQFNADDSIGERYWTEEQNVQGGRKKTEEKNESIVCFISLNQLENTTVAAASLHHSILIFVFNEENHTMRTCPIVNAENCHAVVWSDDHTLVYSTKDFIVMGRFELPNSFQELRRCPNGFTPNFAFSFRQNDLVLFGELGRKMLLFDVKTFPKSKVVPVGMPHAMTVCKDENLLGTYGHHMLFEASITDFHFPSVSAVSPVTLTTSRIEKVRNSFVSQEPDYILRIIPCEIDETVVAVILRGQKILFVKLPEKKCLFANTWPVEIDDLENVFFAFKNTDVIVIGVNKLARQYNLREKTVEFSVEVFEKKPGDSGLITSLTFSRGILYCSTSTLVNGVPVIKIFRMIEKSKEWHRICERDLINSTQLRGLSNGVLLLPSNIENPQCQFISSEHFISGFTENDLPFSMPLVYDVYDEEDKSFLVGVHQKSVILHEIQDEFTFLKRMCFGESASKIEAVKFIPRYERIVAIVYISNIDLEFRICIWNVDCDDQIFEIDLKNTVHSFSFLDEERLNSKLFWSDEFVFYLNERSLVEIDLESLKSSLIFDSGWLLEPSLRFDAIKSFCCRSNLWLIMDNNLMYWLKSH